MSEASECLHDAMVKHQKIESIDTMGPYAMFSDNNMNLKL